MKTIIRIAFEEGVHTNQEYRKIYFSVQKGVNKKSPLSMTELQRLSDLDLSSDYHLNLSKSIFLLGSFLGLRISDLKRIEPKMMSNTGNGKFLRIKNVKTSREVIIPIKNKCDIILERYSYKLPKFTEQVVNRHLKIVAKMMGLSKERQQK
ncbi:MAG: integrase [Saprospiraceae bacterium]